MLVVRPISLKDANRYVMANHSHRGPVRGHKFSVCCMDGDRLCGVAIASRPVSRMLDDGTTLELTRVCTDRTPHVASKLIAACTRAAFAMGYVRLVSYTRAEEEGHSYRAAGWTRATDESGAPLVCGGDSWDTPSYVRTEPMAEALGLAPRHLAGPKHRWERRAA